MIKVLQKPDTTHKKLIVEGNRILGRTKFEYGKLTHKISMNLPCFIYTFSNPGAYVQISYDNTVLPDQIINDLAPEKLTIRTHEEKRKKIFLTDYAKLDKATAPYQKSYCSYVCANIAKLIVANKFEQYSLLTESNQRAYSVKSHFKFPPNKNHPGYAYYERQIKRRNIIRQKLFKLIKEEDRLKDGYRGRACDDICIPDNIIPIA